MLVPTVLAHSEFVWNLSFSTTEPKRLTFTRLREPTAYYGMPSNAQYATFISLKKWGCITKINSIVRKEK